MPITNFLIDENAKPKSIWCMKSFTLAQALAHKNILNANLLFDSDFNTTISIYSSVINVVYTDELLINNLVAFSTDTIKYTYTLNQSPIIINNYDFDKYLPLTINEIFEQFKLLELYN